MSIEHLALKSDHLSSLVGSPTHSDSTALEARTKFQPWLSRVEKMHGSALSAQTQNSMVALLTVALTNESSEPTADEQSLAAALKQQGLGKPILGQQGLGQNAIFADSPNAEIGGVIGALEAENQQIALYLQLLLR